MSGRFQNELDACLLRRLSEPKNPVYAHKWRRVDMPYGPPISRLAASARTTSVKDSTGSLRGWPTPLGLGSSEGQNRPSTNASIEETKKLLRGWPTPDAREGRGGLMSSPEAAMRRRAGGHMVNLEDAVLMAGWASPTARDHKDTDGMAKESTNPDGSRRKRTDQLPRQAFLTGWGTPRGSDADNNYRNIEVAIAEAERRGGNNRLGAAAILSLAQTERLGPSRTLSPAFSRWLMGYPPEWDESAENSVDWLRWQVLMAPLCGELRTIGLRALGAMETPSSHKRRLP